MIVYRYLALLEGPCQLVENKQDTLEENEKFCCCSFASMMQHVTLLSLYVHFRVNSHSGPKGE
jgi:hypothetical protein